MFLSLLAHSEQQNKITQFRETLFLLDNSEPCRCSHSETWKYTRGIFRGKKRQLRSECPRFHREYEQNYAPITILCNSCKKNPNYASHAFYVFCEKFRPLIIKDFMSKTESLSRTGVALKADSVSNFCNRINVAHSVSNDPPRNTRCSRICVLPDETGSTRMLTR